MAMTVDIIYGIFMIINFFCVGLFDDNLIKELKSNKLMDKSDIKYILIKNKHIKQFYKYTIYINSIFVFILLIIHPRLSIEEIDENTSKTIFVWIFLYIGLSLLMVPLFINFIKRGSIHININNADITEEMIELELKKRYAILMLCFLPIFLIGILLGALQLFNGIGVHIIFK